MGSHYPLPFFASSDLLPAPLPTFEAIEASQEILQDHPSCRVVRVGIYFVVKYGTTVSLTEGENMLFAKQFSTVPVPAVYAIFSHHHEGKSMPTTYIVMENIPGETLESRWPSLDDSGKAAIANTLRNHLTQLRRIPSPGYFGLLGKRPFDCSVFWTSEEETREVISGPFDTVQQMLEAIAHKYQHTHPGFRKAEYYRRSLPITLRDHAPVLPTETFSGRTSC